MFSEFEELAKRQDAPLDMIEKKNVLDSVNSVDSAVENLKVGIQRQNQGTIILVAILGVFFLLLVGIVVAVFVGKAALGGGG